MEKERLQKAGDYILDGVLIVGSSGARINVADQVQELNIYESINSPFISGNLLIYKPYGSSPLANCTLIDMAQQSLRGCLSAYTGHSRGVG